jgi:hypothetical protein
MTLEPAIVHYAPWIMAGSTVAVLVAGTGCSLAWGFRGLVGVYATVAALSVLRMLTIKVVLVPAAILIPPMLLILCFLAVVSWTTAVLLRPHAGRFCSAMKRS